MKTWEEYLIELSIQKMKELEESVCWLGNFEKR